MERLFLLVAWRSLIKGVSERKPDPTTPAMRKGLTERPWGWSRLLGRRLFPDRLLGAQVLEGDLPAGLAHPEPTLQFPSQPALDVLTKALPTISRPLALTGTPQT